MKNMTFRAGSFLGLLLSFSLHFSATAEETTGGLVLLAGETVRWSSGAKTPQEVDLSTTAAKILGTEVRNKTAPGLTLSKIREELPQLIAEKPAVVIVFAGNADERANTPDQEQVATVSGIAKGLLASGARVFFVPSRTNINASIAANLRIGASAGGATYVETGSEFDSMPYEETLREIGELRKRAVGASVFDTPPARKGNITTATPPIPSPAHDATSSGKVRTVSIDPETTVATIYMEPPAPLKQFSPQKPVPYRRKKVPEFSR